MDILDRFALHVQAVLGADVFTEETLARVVHEARLKEGAESHYVASVRAFDVSQRHAKVRRLAEQGLGNTAIAERTGFDRSTVWRIRQSA